MEFLVILPPTFLLVLLVIHMVPVLVRLRVILMSPVRVVFLAIPVHGLMHGMKLWTSEVLHGLHQCRMH